MLARDARGRRVTNLVAKHAALGSLYSKKAESAFDDYEEFLDT